MSTKLFEILKYIQLADLSDLEQVRLLAIAETVANTRMAFDQQLVMLYSKYLHLAAREHGIQFNGASHTCICTWPVCQGSGAHVGQKCVMQCSVQLHL